MKITYDFAPFSTSSFWFKKNVSALLILIAALPFSTFAADDSPFELCPIEIKRHIFSFLNVEELTQVAPTSKQNKAIADDLFKDPKYLEENIRAPYLKHIRLDITKADLLTTLMMNIIQRPLNTLTPDLLYVIGYSYDHAIGLTGDTEKALIYYDAASEQGHPEALKSSINYHQNGYAGTPDMAKANKFKEKLPPQRKSILTYVQDMVTCFCLPFYLQHLEIHQK